MQAIKNQIVLFVGVSVYILYSKQLTVDDDNFIMFSPSLETSQSVDIQIKQLNIERIKILSRRFTCRDKEFITILTTI